MIGFMQDDSRSEWQTYRVQVENCEGASSFSKKKLPQELLYTPSDDEYKEFFADQLMKCAHRCTPTERYGFDLMSTEDGLTLVDRNSPQEGGCNYQLATLSFVPARFGIVPVVKPHVTADEVGARIAEHFTETFVRNVGTSADDLLGKYSRVAFVKRTRGVFIRIAVAVGVIVTLVSVVKVSGIDTTIERLREESTITLPGSSAGTLARGEFFRVLGELRKGENSALREIITAADRHAGLSPDQAVKTYSKALGGVFEYGTGDDGYFHHVRVDDASQAIGYFVQKLHQLNAPPDTRNPFNADQPEMRAALELLGSRNAEHRAMGLEKFKELLTLEARNSVMFGLLSKRAYMDYLKYYCIHEPDLALRAAAFEMYSNLEYEGTP
jgi:hypothetical protein